MLSEEDFDVTIDKSEVRDTSSQSDLSSLVPLQSVSESCSPSITSDLPGKSRISKRKKAGI